MRTLFSAGGGFSGVPAVASAPSPSLETDSAVCSPELTICGSDVVAAAAPPDDKPPFTASVLTSAVSPADELPSVTSVLTVAVEISGLT
jgi:hypothetical protein